MKRPRDGLGMRASCTIAYAGDRIAQDISDWSWGVNVDPEGQAVLARVQTEAQQLCESDNHHLFL